MSHEQLSEFFSLRETIVKGGCVRGAVPQDAELIFRMLHMSHDHGGVLPRQYEEILTMCNGARPDGNSSKFFVYQAGAYIVGCAAADVYATDVHPAQLIEIRSVRSLVRAIPCPTEENPQAKFSVGSAVTKAAIAYARTFTEADIFLTTNIPWYFEPLGFRKEKSGHLVVYKHRSSIDPAHLVSRSFPFHEGEIRPARMEDMPDVLALQQKGITEGTIKAWDENRIRRHLDTIAVYQTRAGVKGVAAFVPHCKRLGEFRHVFVDHDARGHGVGSMVMRALETTMWQSGVLESFMSIQDNQRDFCMVNGMRDDREGGKDILWLTEPIGKR